MMCATQGSKFFSFCTLRIAKTSRSFDACRIRHSSSSSFCVLFIYKNCFRVCDTELQLTAHSCAIWRESFSSLSSQAWRSFETRQISSNDVKYFSLPGLQRTKSSSRDGWEWEMKDAVRNFANHRDCQEIFANNISLLLSARRGSKS